MRIKYLLQRDGINCGLCKNPVDLTLRCPHPLSATVGHIIPRARGGDDGPKNLRLEHWDCNQRKGTYLDSELDPKTLAPPDPMIDVVAYIQAMKKQSDGGKRSILNLLNRDPDHQRHAGSKGGHRLKELHPEVARLAGLHPKSLEALNRGRTLEHQRSASAKGGWRLVHKNNPGKAREWGKLGAEKTADGRGGRARAEKHSKEELSNWGRLAGLKGGKSLGAQEALRRGRHTYWHVRRKQQNPDCKFCQAALLEALLCA